MDDKGILFNIMAADNLVTQGVGHQPPFVNFVFPEYSGFSSRGVNVDKKKLKFLVSQTDRRCLQCWVVLI